ncbi:MAG: hypothetical protein WEC84_01355, partial [Candidatus Andersenbacteria bacterium]
IGTRKRQIQLPVNDSDIKAILFRKNPFGHSCVVIRKSIFINAGGYDNNLRYAQDRDLWFRLMPQTTFANIPEFLVTRLIDTRISKTNKREQTITSMRLAAKYIRLYKASALNYFFLLEPALAYCSPLWLRHVIRKVI